MNIERTAISEDFYTGQGIATAIAAPIVADGFNRKVFRGIRVKNTGAVSLYVGPSNVSFVESFILLPGDSLPIPVDELNKVWVLAAEACAYAWVAL